MSNIQYKCDTCSFSQDVQSRCRVYDWNGLKNFHPLIRIGWCRKCMRVGEVEYVPPLEELENELVLVQNNAPFEERLFTVGNWQVWELQFITNYIEWRKSRILPSRCFECGETDLLIPNQRFGDLPCPVCAGTLCCHLRIVAGSHNHDPDVYSSEGELLRKGAGLIACYSSWTVPD